MSAACHLERLFPATEGQYVAVRRDCPCVTCRSYCEALDRIREIDGEHKEVLRLRYEEDNPYAEPQP